MSWTDNPVHDAELYFDDNRKHIGICAECGYKVYAPDDVAFEEDYPMHIEGKYFHENCVMEYARRLWRVDSDRLIIRKGY